MPLIDELLGSVASILDILTRHQVYLEGVKDWAATIFDPYLARLVKLVTGLFQRFGITTFEGVTKAKFQTLLAALKRGQIGVYTEYVGDLVRALREFTFAEKVISAPIFTKVAGKTAVGLPTAQSLFQKVISDPNPATGQTLTEMISAFTGASAKEVENAVVQGYVNKDTVTDVQKAILGTKAAKRRDGILGKIWRRAKTVTNTAIQHASQQVQAGIARQFFDEYQWQSVLDSRTSEICRSRNGQVYQYGKGPLPPAHPNCRSKVVPVGAAGPKLPVKPPTYFDWIIAQPVKVQNDLLGLADAKRLRTGKLKGENFPLQGEVKDLTPEQFKGKLALMLMPPDEDS